MNQQIITWLLLLPFMGGLVVLMLPQKGAKFCAVLISLANFVVSLHLPFHFQTQEAALQFVQSIPWIPAFGIHYGVGIDGVSLWLVMLTTFLTPLAILSAWNSVKKHGNAFFAFLLWLEAGMLGAFVATDLFLFYVFWEAMLIPMYFLIGIWGSDRRVYATIKFFIFTMAGSLVMLFGMVFVLMLYQKQFGHYSADIQSLYKLPLPVNLQVLLFGCFGISFAIKVPMFLLHTWLPDAHVEAPTAGSVILAGVLLKMGGYGFLRLAMPMFPLGFEYFTPLLLWLSVIGIVYGALVAMVQPDMKKLVAYSSVSHLGFVMLGLFVLNLQGLQGGLYQMLNHGLSTGALFLLVGMLYERRHTREIKEFGGLAKVIPLFSVFFVVVTLSSIGLPGLNGFVGEFLILLGAFRSDKVFSVIAATGVVLGAIYMLWLVQRVFFGPLKAKNANLLDMSLREGLILVPLVLLMIVMGVYPQLFLKDSQASMQSLMQHIKQGQK